LLHGYKLIKFVDSSDGGVGVVHTIGSHLRADDLDDENKIYRAQIKADQKIR